MPRRKSESVKKKQAKPVLKTAKTLKPVKVSLPVKVSKNVDNRNSADIAIEGIKKSRAKRDEVLKAIARENEATEVPASKRVYLRPKVKVTGEDFLSKAKNSDTKLNIPALSAEEPAGGRTVKAAAMPVKLPDEAELARVNYYKRLIMVSGVTFFMVLIFFGWIFTTRRQIIKVAPDSGGTIDIEELTAELSDQFSDMKADLEAIKTFAGDSYATGTQAILPENNNNADEYASTSVENLVEPETATTTESINENNDDIFGQTIDELKNKLEAE